MFWRPEAACWERKFFGCPARITPESRLRLSWKDNFAKKGRPDSIWAERNSSAGCGNGKSAMGASLSSSSKSSARSEEHTSELQSHSDLVCRLLLEKKKKNTAAN